MSREIRFRAKRKDDTIHNGAWVYGHYFVAPLTDENSGMPTESGWSFLSGGDAKHCIESDGVVFVVDVETLGEFTGLLDKGDMEIYEGDVANVYLMPCSPDEEMYKAQIEFVDGCFAFADGKNDLPALHALRYEPYTNGYHPCECRVIGNIHDNPELMKTEVSQ